MAEYLSDAGVKRVILMGGTAALSADVQTGIETLGIVVDRMAGATRFETATKFAAYAARHGGGCFAENEVGLARAFLPFDSFSAAPLLASLCAPAVLTDPAAIPEATVEFLNDARSGKDRITLRVFGGNAAVSQEAIGTYLAASRPAGKNYRNRSDNSALPATDRYFIDHDEAAALFPDCQAPDLSRRHPNTLRAVARFFDRYAGFDREVTEGVFNGKPRDFATGWWTDEKLQYAYGNTYPEIDVEWAKANVTMWAWNQIGFGWRAVYTWPDGQTAPKKGPGLYRGLYERIVMDGFVDDATRNTNYWANHQGITPPRRVDPDDPRWIADGGQLLWDWTLFMLQHPPVSREPAAWGMWTLLEARHSKCVAQSMLARCDSPFGAATSPHLRNDKLASPLGIALWNLVCGEYPGS